MPGKVQHDAAKQYRDRAAQTRALADHIIGQAVRKALIEIAEEYERLAKEAEKSKKEE